MQFSEQWMREWVNPKLTTPELAHKLTMAGLEVDSVAPYCEPFTEVVIGLVETCESQGKLSKLSVNVGERLLNIVCGAPNIAQGQKVAVAMEGAHLPAIHQPSEQLKKTTIKDMPSEGMILSLEELGLAEKSEQIHVLHPNAPVGESVWDYMHLDDTIIDVDLTPNRGDCLSMQGVGRELHALTGAPFNPVGVHPIPASHDHQISIDIQDTQSCPRYSARIIENVDCSKKTPDWMIEKLRRSNIKSINPVVDVMNYVMIELGQPMHAFDLNTIEGDIVIRQSIEGEPLTLLDGQQAKMHAHTLMVADRQKPLAIAGIMGGLDSGVTSQTTKVLLESAHFTPEALAGKARSYGLHTDSSHRFERGVCPSGCVDAIERATQWILDICGGEPGSVMDVKSHLKDPQVIEFSPERCATHLGFELNEEQVRQDFERLGCQVEVGTPWQVTAPTFRFDLTIEEDLFEEVARLKGYDNIPNQSGFGPFSTTASGLGVNETRIKLAMADIGYQEAITYSFVCPSMQADLFPEVEGSPLVNPIASDMSMMRVSLFPGLLTALKHNVNRQQDNVALFETGLVFQQNDGLKQTKKLGGLVHGQFSPKAWDTKAKACDFFDVKGHIEHLWVGMGHELDSLGFEAGEHPALHPGICASIHNNNQVIGHVGQLHPSLESKLDIKGPVFLFEMNVDPILSTEALGFEKYSIYPEIKRDLSMVLSDSTPANQVMDWIKANAGIKLKKVELFDVYAGSNLPEGSKSLALSLLWQDFDKTLTDEAIEGLMTPIIQGLKQTFDATLRE